jgi:electron transport complex protein RnfC
MKLKTFHKGGVHPEENKLSAQAAIEVLPLPKQVAIPVSQHIGAPARLLVKKGDEVRVGTLLAEASGFISANIHSSVSGKVFKIEDVIDTSGYKKQAIIINVEGDEWEEGIDKSETLIKDIKATPQEILDKVKGAGIVGLGGATFPTHVKFMVPEGRNVDTLVINGVECEPYLTSDDRIMIEKADELLVGIQIAMKAISVTRAIIGIENNKPEAIKNLKEKLKDYPGIEVEPLKVLYPQGGEKQLIKSVLNKEVPSGGLPLEVGAVVMNVGTAISVYYAVQKNRPLFERVVTVTGKSVTKPSNFMVRIGTSVNELIEAAGGLPEDTGKVVNGGPMMGKALTTTDVPVTKGSSGILIMTKAESKRFKEQVCIRCAKCVSICPMGLEPYLLSAKGKKRFFEELEGLKVMDCIECGSCSYTCPANLPLLDYIRLGKLETGKIIRARKK